MIAHQPANLGLGLGLRGPHLGRWLRDPPAEVQWLEVITDNYLANRGWLRRVLVRLAEIRPVVLHGVGLNIGSVDRIDRDYLRQVGELAAEVRAPWVSDHLCWTGVDGLQSHDLLPMPYTTAALNWLVDRVRQVQDHLGRPLILENPSSYLSFRRADWTEWEFLAELCERADCGLLLDVNNVHVSAHNHGFSEQQWLAAVPWHRVWQLHVAGHTTYATHKLDTHVGPVPDAVWQLYGQAWSASGGRSTLLEWDDDIPDLDVAVAELCKARAWQTEPPVTLRAPDSRGSAFAVRPSRRPPRELVRQQRAVLRQIASGKPNAEVSREILPTHLLSPADRVAIHGRMYRQRLDGALAEDFPKTSKWLGKRAFAAACAAFRRAHPPRNWALERYGERFSIWLASEPRFAGLAAELARIEWAIVQARLAPGSEPLPADWALGLGDVPLAQCRLRFAHGARAMRVSAEAWQAWSGATLAEPRQQILRLSPTGNRVAVQGMAPAEAAAFRSLQTGCAILATCELVARRSPAWAIAIEAELGHWLQAWVTDGAVVGVDPG